MRRKKERRERREEKALNRVEAAAAGPRRRFAASRPRGGRLNAHPTASEVVKINTLTWTMGSRVSLLWNGRGLSPYPFHTDPTQTLSKCTRERNQKDCPRAFRGDLQERKQYNTEKHFLFAVSMCGIVG